MNITCQIQKLKTAISFAEKITSKHVTLPVLGNILLVAGDGTLKVRATNLNLGIEVTVPAKITKEGVCAVSGSVLYQLISNTVYKDDTITLTLDNTVLKTTIGKSKATIKTVPYEDFPTIPTVDGSVFVFPADKLTLLFRSVLFSAAQSDIKPEIGSVMLSSQDDEVVAVATDSFRLAEKKIKNKNNDGIPTVLIPAKNISEIIKIIGEYSEDISVTISENQISFKTKDLFLTSRLVAGVFPDYKQIIPKKVETESTVLKQDLLQALKSVSIFSDKFSQVTVSFGSTGIAIHAANHDVGENTTILPVKVNGPDFSGRFNARYLIDVFQALGGDSVTFELSGANKPMIIKGTGDPSFMYLVMPMNN